MFVRGWIRNRQNRTGEREVEKPGPKKPARCSGKGYLMLPAWQLPRSPTKRHTRRIGTTRKSKKHSKTSQHVSCILRATQAPNISPERQCPEIRLSRLKFRFNNRNWESTKTSVDVYIGLYTWTYIWKSSLKLNTDFSTSSRIIVHIAVLSSFIGHLIVVILLNILEHLELRETARANDVYWLISKYDLACKSCLV